MIHAFVTIVTGTGAEGSVAATLRTVDAVTEVHVVAGDFDVVAEVTTETPRDLLGIVSNEIRSLEDVGTSRTYICIDETCSVIPPPDASTTDGS